jgi:DNA polymerase I-like protein with 3'-5' exonuclease and polymerase domains
MQQGWVVKVLKEKLLRTPTGLIFYWPDTEITRSGYITNTPSIFNYPIQMFATGDIAPTGVCLLWHNMKALNLQSFLINEVHDNVLSEEHPEEHEIMGNLVPKCLSKDIIPFFKTVFNIDLNFPLEVDQRLETNWT